MGGGSERRNECSKITYAVIIDLLRNLKTFIKEQLLGIVTNETVSGNKHVLVRGLDVWQRLHALTLDGQPIATYAYDSDNQLSAISNAAFVAEYHYTPDGYDAGYSVTLTNGVLLNRVVSRDVWRRNLISQISNGVDNAALSMYQYGYDELNRATSRNTDSFSYNPRSEVTNATLNAIGYTYAYDNIGNHTASTVDSVETTYTANSLNQYSQISVPSVPSVENLSYDPDGNLLTNGVWVYTWDAENRMTAAYSNSVCVVSNAYDYMSRRVVKWTPSHTTTFVYDGWNLVQELTHSQTHTLTNSYVWGKDLSGTMQGAGGIGGLLAVKQGNAWYFPLSDANGNITGYIDEQGTLVAEYTYDAFGGTIAQSGSMADTFMHRFSTKYYDSETGLYYYGYRFYSPYFHRWLNRDPIEEDGGLNLYAFCENDGVNRWDLLGWQTFEYREEKIEYVKYVIIAFGCDAQGLTWVNPFENKSSTKCIQSKIPPYKFVADITLRMIVHMKITDVGTLDPKHPEKGPRTVEGVRKTKEHEDVHRKRFEEAYKEFKGYYDGVLAKSWNASNKLSAPDGEVELKNIRQKIETRWKKIQWEENDHRSPDWTAWNERHEKENIPKTIW